MKKKATKEESLTKKQIESLKTMALSFYFLADEAERDGFKEMNIYLREGIFRIDNLLNKQKNPPMTRIIDESLFNAMKFLYKLNQLSESSRIEFVSFFNSLKEICVSNKLAIKPKNGKLKITEHTLQ